MKNYKALSDSELLEMLALYTAQYTNRLQINSESKGQQETKTIIDDLVAEICQRKSQSFSKAKAY